MEESRQKITVQLQHTKMHFRFAKKILVCRAHRLDKQSVRWKQLRTIGRNSSYIARIKILILTLEINK